MATYITANSLTRTNTWALNSNALKVFGVERIKGYFATAFSVVITDDGDTTTITPSAGHVSPLPRYFKYVLTDESGNEAFGLVNNTNGTTAAAAVVIDTTALRAGDSWLLEFAAKQEESDGGAQVNYQVKIDGAAGNPTVTVSN